MSVDKSPDAFRTISEVAADLDLPQHVLRFWETKFSQIKPMKRGGGRRYYRPDDVDLLRGIRHLLYGEGYTIKGAQKILREQGVRQVMQVWRDEFAAPPPAQAAPRTTQDPAPAEPQPVADKVKAAETPVPAAEPVPEDLPRDIRPEQEKAPSDQPFRFMDRFKSSPQTVQPAALSKQDVDNLQSTLLELLECKRLLDQAR